MHGPSLTSVSGRSTNEPRQQAPKSPLSAITVRSEPLAGVALVIRSSSGSSASSVVTRIVADWVVAGPAGWYSTVNVISAPGVSASGVDGSGSTENAGDPDTRATSSTIRSVVPTLETVRVRYSGPRQTVPNCRSSCRLTATTGP